MTIICGVGAQLLPRKYESTTTIWVQRDEILNPLVSYQMAVQLASSDRLETFNEIVYSRRTLEELIDSVGIDMTMKTGEQWDEMIEKIRWNIRTFRKGMNSFSMAYVDTDPVLAQRMVSVLAEVFIAIRLRGESRRNELTVQFFEAKLEEYRQKYEETQKDVFSLMRLRMRERPSGSSVLYDKLTSTEKQINDATIKQTNYQILAAKLELFPDAFNTPQGKQGLVELKSSEVPFAGELRSALDSYEDLVSRYTPLYPEVSKKQAEVFEILNRMRYAVQSEQVRLRTIIPDLQKLRQDLIENIMRSSVQQQTDADVQSYNNLYKQLYDDMKIKLEQAKTAKELGKNAENSFIIIDPARVPATSSKPNRLLITLGGFGAGAIIAILGALLAEMFDTRVRGPRDIEIYHLPVVALLPNGRGHHRAA